MLSDDASTILIIEDKREWHILLTALCENAGYRVVSVYDASAARLHSQGLHPLPVLALVDLELPSSASQHSLDDGLQIVADLRDQGIYTIIVSAHIPEAQAALLGRPEVYDLVDKYHFTQAGFGNDVFMATVRQAVAYAEAARRAEGQLPAQQAVLHRLRWPPHAAT